MTGKDSVESGLSTQGCTNWWTGEGQTGRAEDVTLCLWTFTYAIMLPDRDSLLLLALGIPHGKSPLSLKRGKQLEPSFALQTNLWQDCEKPATLHRNHHHPTLEINYYSFRGKRLKEFIWTFSENIVKRE